MVGGMPVGQEGKDLQRLIIRLMTVEIYQLVELRVIINFNIALVLVWLKIIGSQIPEQRDGREIMKYC